MAKTTEFYSIPEKSTCLAAVASLFADPMCAKIFAGHDIRKDYSPNEVAEFERVERSFFKGMNVFGSNIDLIRALARRTVVGDFSSPDDPSLGAFLSEHFFYFRDNSNFHLRGRKISVEDFLTVANLLLKDVEYLDSVRIYGQHRDDAYAQSEAEDARFQFQSIEFKIIRNLGCMDVRPIFSSIVMRAAMEGAKKIDEKYLKNEGTQSLEKTTLDMIEW